MKDFYSTQSSDSSNDSAPTFNSGNTEKGSGRKHTDEAKNKISDAASKRRHSESTKALLSELNSGSKIPCMGKTLCRHQVLSKLNERRLLKPYVR